MNVLTNGKDEIASDNIQETIGLFIVDGRMAVDKAWWKRKPNNGNTYIMLDLETLGVQFNPVIAQISMAEFDLLTGEVLAEFSVNVDTGCGVGYSLTTDQSTLDFWKKQPDDVKARVFTKDALLLENALILVSEWIKARPDAFIWGNGVRTDNVWLLSAFRALGMSDPFEYNKDLDYRTLYKLAELKADMKNLPKPWKDVEFTGLQHYAPDDCRHQIKKAHLMWKFLYD
jgi:hypothetical protein